MSIRAFRLTRLSLAAACLLPQAALADSMLTSPDLLEAFQGYGILKPFFSWDERDKALIGQGSNRLGVRVEQPFNDKITAFGQSEFSVNVVNNNDNTSDVVATDDPETGVGTVDFPVSTRLGYVALQSELWSLSIGKQWAVWYDVAGITDYFPIFGGEAVGAYAGGTDGGATGTGRAGQAMQFRVDPYGFGLKVGLQAQLRSTDDSDKDYADTYTGSLTYTFDLGQNRSFFVGGSYHKIRGGADTDDNVDLSNDLPRKQTEGAVVGFDLYWDKFRAALTVARLNDIEFDDEGTPIQAWGTESYIRYAFNRTWQVFGGWNYQDPDNYKLDDGSTSQYKLRYIDIGLGYAFGKTSLAFIEAKIEDSKSARGKQVSVRPSTIAFGYLYSFGY